MTAIIGICAATSNMGKTTLICRLIPILAQRGIRVSVIKHTHHAFEIDHAGKDSYQIHQAGAVQTLLGNAQRWALVSQMPQALEDDQGLQYLLQQIDPKQTDLVLIEGFKYSHICKIEVYRAELNSPLLAMQDKHIIAVASNTPVIAPCTVLNLNQVELIADFIEQYIAQGNTND